MPSSPTSRSLCLSITSVAFALGGCSDDACGPGGAPAAAGITVAGDNISATYGGFSAGQNNDCPEADAPSGVISLSIHGTQDNGTAPLTFCIGRPDNFTTKTLTLGPDAAGSPVRVVDVSGSANGCTFALDRTAPITGTARTTGMCGNGSDAAGFALVVDGAVTVKRTCGATVDSVPVTVKGTVAVAAQ